jgi:hypothetical protein
MSKVCPCVHFVGFRDDSYHNAVKVFGLPDFYHRYWDRRAADDVAPGDTVVFARQKDWDRFVNNQPVEFAFNDSEVF